MSESAGPRRARVIDSKYILFGSGLNRIGLLNQEFRVEEEEESTVIAHPDDWRPNSSREQRRIIKDILEFLPES
ncbi:MAG: hypothetical protein AAB469_01945 [Patescibacteria group bacterium]